MSAYKFVFTLVTGETFSRSYYNDYDYVKAMETARNVMNNPKSYTTKDGAGDIKESFIRNSAIIKIDVVKKGEEER